LANVPANVVGMKVSKKYIVHRFGSNTSISKAGQIGLMEVIHHRHARVRNAFRFASSV
jgi:hypothetical protein